MINEIRNAILRGLKNNTSIRVAISSSDISLDTYLDVLDSAIPKGAGVYVVDKAGDVYIISIEQAKDKGKR